MEGAYVERLATNADVADAPAFVLLLDDLDTSPWDNHRMIRAAEGALATSLQARFARIDAHALPHAADLAHLAVDAWYRGEAIAPERVEPAYLRNNVALTLEEQKALRARG